MSVHLQAQIATLQCLLSNIPCISVTNAQMIWDEKIAFKWQ